MSFNVLVCETTLPLSQFCTDSAPDGQIIIPPDQTPYAGAAKVCAKYGLAPYVATTETFLRLKSMMPVCLASSTATEVWIGSYYGITFGDRPLALTINNATLFVGQSAKPNPVACGPFYTPVDRKFLSPPFQSLPKAIPLVYGGDASKPVTLTTTATATVTTTSTVTIPGPTITPPCEK